MKHLCCVTSRPDSNLATPECGFSEPFFKGAHQFVQQLPGVGFYHKTNGAQAKAFFTVYWTFRCAPHYFGNVLKGRSRSCLLQELGGAEPGHFVVYQYADRQACGSTIIQERQQFIAVLERKHTNLRVMALHCQAKKVAIIGIIVRQYDEWYDGGQTFIRLRHRPIHTLIGVSEYRGPIE